MSKLNDHPDPATRWKHRRRMAYATLAVALVYPFAAGPLSVPDWTVWPFYSCVFGVLGGYVGGSVWETLNIIRGK